MNENELNNRIDEEIAVLERLKKSSSIFDFVVEGDPVEQFNIIFNGKGLFLKDSVDDEVEYVELHRIEISFPTSFPKTEPEVRWRSEIFHPNISFSGFIDLDEIGLKWQEEMTLDVICDRLWDVARVAYYNIETASNYTAKKWYEQECAIKLPVDPRPLRDRATAQPENAISYKRFGNEEPAVQAQVMEENILYIGDEAPATEPEPANEPDDGIEFIGD